MSPVGQGYCSGAEWGMDGKHICTVRGVGTAGKGGILHCIATVSIAEDTWYDDNRRF
jgi:hypothetical protein